MYQGGRQDPLTQLYHFDHRDYSPSLGTWTSQDPLQYINGVNTYQFVMSNPVGNVDPSGEVWQWIQSTWNWLQSPFAWMGNMIEGVANYAYAGMMAQMNSGENANYYNQIMYGHNLPPNLRAGTPMQRFNLDNGIAAFKKLGKSVPGTSVTGPCDLPITPRAYGKALGKKSLEKVLSK
jgi:RHS repeat-associated protein